MLPTPPSSDQQAHREKWGVAAASLVAALGMTVAKLIIGLATNSLGILSEAAHSGLDLLATGMTLWAVHVSGQPADRNHTYGHGKFENLAALAETVLLLAVCAWIIYEAIARLVFRAHVEVEPSVWAFLVVLGSIAVDLWRSHALSRAAQKYSSQALEADALHFATDVWSSLVVLFGLLMVALAQRLEQPWLMQADTVAALVVAAVVVGVSLRLGRKPLADPVDAIPHGLQEQVTAAAAAVSGVEDVRQVRVRRSGPEVFADLTVSVGRQLGLEQAHDVADRTERAVRALLPDADVVVHVEPVTQTDEQLETTVRTLAARLGIAAHGVRTYVQRGKRSVELHLEVSPSLSLQDAHHQASQFERLLRESVPGLVRIVTHLEPVGEPDSTSRAEPAAKRKTLEAIEQFLAQSDVAANPHDVHVRLAGDELAISLHCTLDASMGITEAHEFTRALESYLRAHVANVGRVVIHVEPSQEPRLD